MKNIVLRWNITDINTFLLTIIEYNDEMIDRFILPNVNY